MIARPFSFTSFTLLPKTAGRQGEEEKKLIFLKFQTVVLDPDSEMLV